MRRLLFCCGLLVMVAAQTGCHRSLYQASDKFGCSGCGHRYWGAYVEDPPRPEPCDECGNWVGNCGSCGSCKSRGNRRGESFSFLQSRLNGLSLFGRGACCEDDGCGEATCTEASCTETTCAEPPIVETTCGEAGCGEAGCGCAGGTTSNGVLRGGLLSGGARNNGVAPVASRSPKRTTVRQVSRPTVMSAATLPQSGGCNCGRH